MRLWITPLFVVSSALGSLVGAHCAISGVLGRNDTYFGDLTAFNKFSEGILGAIRGDFWDVWPHFWFASSL